MDCYNFKMKMTFRDALHRITSPKDLGEVCLVFPKISSKWQTYFLSEWIELKFSDEYFINHVESDTKGLTLFLFFLRNKKECFGLVSRILEEGIMFDLPKTIEIDKLKENETEKANSYLEKVFYDNKVTIEDKSIVKWDEWLLNHNENTTNFETQYIFNENLTNLFYIFGDINSDTSIYYNNKNGEPYILTKESYQSGHAWLSRISGSLISWDQVAVIANKCNNEEYKNISSNNYQEFIKISPYNIEDDYLKMEQLMNGFLPFLVYYKNNYGAQIYFLVEEGKKMPIHVDIEKLFE